MESLFTNEELALQLGSAVKKLRLLKNIDRKTLCDRAQISLNALRHLENGDGASVTTLIAVAKTLGKTDWLRGLMPQITVNPLDSTLNRKRASRTSTKVKSDLQHRKASLKQYGLTIEDFVAMHKLQEGKCGNSGCQSTLDLLDPHTHVDHDHESGKVRSLLCSGCNTALGLLKENKERASGLVKYILTHSPK